MSEFVVPVLRFADMVETIFVSTYKTLRFSSPLGYLTFYVYLILALILVYRSFLQKNVKLYYRIVEEGEVNEIVQSVQEMNREVLKNVQDLVNEAGKTQDGRTGDRLSVSAMELKVVEDMYSEFSDEILDSHNSIRDSLKLPQMK